MNAKEMWNRPGLTGTYETVSFGEGKQMNAFAALILKGKKTATSSAYYWYEISEETMPAEGKY